MNTPQKLREEGKRLANLSEWGSRPPLWHTAMAQADWEVEARLMEKELEVKGIKMTPEQQRFVRYAEVMGWKLEGTARYGVWVGGEFGVVDGSFCVKRVDASYPETWNPLTDANDALELAEKMNVAFERREPWPESGPWYWAEIDAVGFTSDTLPAAICAAVDAFLDSKKG